MLIIRDKVVFRKTNRILLIITSIFLYFIPSISFSIDMGDENLKYFPLSVGNAWTYIWTVGGGESEETIEIVDKVIVKNGTMFEANENLYVKHLGSNFPCKVYYGIINKRINKLIIDMLDNRQRETIISFPIKIGKKWKNDKMEIDKEKGVAVNDCTYIIISLNKEVNVLAGNFKECLLIRRSNNEDYYYAPNVGLVLQEDKSLKMKKELTEYNIENESNK